MSADVWRVLHTVSCYLFPFLAVLSVLLILSYILTESLRRREKVRSLPGAGTVGEIIVLSGSRDLEPNTWFPVPREGVLGSVRSCDLVIPCPGVRSKHLDFSWEDGIGLLIRPRTGCEALINDVPVSCRTNAEEVPLTHGSVLQVGSAILRLHLFAALDNTVAPACIPHQDLNVMQEFIPAGTPLPEAGTQENYSYQFPSQEIASQKFISYDSVPSSPDLPNNGSEEPPVRPEVKPERLRRSDRWKEDLGE